MFGSPFGCSVGDSLRQRPHSVVLDVLLEGRGFTRIFHTTVNFNIMLDNVCICLFYIGLWQQLSMLVKFPYSRAGRDKALGVLSIALLALRLGGWAPITTRHGFYSSPSS